MWADPTIAPVPYAQTPGRQAGEKPAAKAGLWVGGGVGVTTLLEMGTPHPALGSSWGAAVMVQ